MVKWEFEPMTFWFMKIKRGIRSYLPDFKVWPQGSPYYYVEVKGYMDAKSKTKIKRMAKYYPRIDLRVVGKAEYKVLTARYSHLPGWEFPGGRSNPLTHPEDAEGDLGAIPKKN